MKCDSPCVIRLDKPKFDGEGGLIYSIPVACGKCYLCKKRRANQWAYKLGVELDNSDSAYFVTLTYASENLPINENGKMTLVKKDVQDFIKRLRYHEENADYKTAENFFKVKNGWKPTGKHIKYYAVGEYGSRRKRPHYHIIIFNVIDQCNINKAWSYALDNSEDTLYIPIGSTHIDEDVNENNIDYTLKYMLKGSDKIPKGVQKEFSINSKGLGNSMLSSEYARLVKKRIDINYVVSKRGYKVAMPKTFREKILDKSERDKQIGIIKREVEKNQKEKEEIFGKMKINMYLYDGMGKKARNNLLNKVNERSID